MLFVLLSSALGVSLPLESHSRWPVPFPPGAPHTLGGGQSSLEAPTELWALPLTSGSGLASQTLQMGRKIIHLAHRHTSHWGS